MGDTKAKSSARAATVRASTPCQDLLADPYLHISDYYREKKAARSIPASRAAAGKLPEAAAPRRTERAAFFSR